jgi:hypothetical protein
MTDTRPATHGHGDLRQEEDRIASRPIVAIGVAALVLFFLASWVTIGYLRVRFGGDRPPLLPAPEVGQSKIGLVEQQQFELAMRGERAHEAQRARLEGYGWVDRAAGIVHVPIEQAMELTIQGVRPAAAPGGTTPEGQP